MQDFLRQSSGSAPDPEAPTVLSLKNVGARVGSKSSSRDIEDWEGTSTNVDSHFDEGDDYDEDEMEINLDGRGMGEDEDTSLDQDFSNSTHSNTPLTTKGKKGKGRASAVAAAAAVSFNPMKHTTVVNEALGRQEARRLAATHTPVPSAPVAKDKSSPEPVAEKRGKQKGGGVKEGSPSSTTARTSIAEQRVEDEETQGSAILEIKKRALAKAGGAVSETVPSTLSSKRVLSKAAVAAPAFIAENNITVPEQKSVTWSTQLPTHRSNEGVKAVATPPAATKSSAASEAKYQSSISGGSVNAIKLNPYSRPGAALPPPVLPSVTIAPLPPRSPGVGTAPGRLPAVPIPRPPVMQRNFNSRTETSVPQKVNKIMMP